MNYNLVGFEFYEQQIQNVLQVIKTIKPVISIIRNSYKVNNRLEELHEEGIKTNGKIEAYYDILNMQVDKSLTQKIESEISILKATIQKNMVEYKKLKEDMSDLEEEIYEYIKYIHSFDWLHVQLLSEVMSRIPLEDNELNLAAMLLFTNKCIEESERAEILKYLCAISKDKEIQDALILMEVNEEYTLFDYISSTV